MHRQALVVRSLIVRLRSGGFGRTPRILSIAAEPGQGAARGCRADRPCSPLCLHGCPLRRTIEDGLVREADVFLRHREGHRVAVRVRTATVRDREGAVVGGLEVFTDRLDREGTAARLAELERLAMVDTLTELPNRRYLEMSLESRLSEWSRYGRPFGLLMIDIDDFKELNDQHGHLVGDDALRLVARTLAHSARPSDVVGRWGGEEFLGVVVEVDRARLREVGERLRSMVERSTLRTAAGPVQVTVSAGASLAEEGDAAADVLRRADERLFQAKAAGKNRVVG